MNLQPGRVLSLQLSLPCVMNSGEDKTTFTEHKALGTGDMRITAWLDLSEWFIFRKDKDAGDEEEIPDDLLKDPFSEMAGETAQKTEPTQKKSFTHFRLGFGARLPTGRHKLRDDIPERNQYRLLLPARYQPGYGTASPVLGAGYRQNFGKLRAVATLQYEFSGGKNSVKYQHGDILRLDANLFYPLLEKPLLVAGLGHSLTWIPREDRSNHVKVANSDGTFRSVTLTAVLSVYKGLSALVVVKIPYGSSSSTTGNDIDRQYSLGLMYNF